ncbi:hypothetical protein L207DRAFT_624945, partial [Hyaloscypha variabilis F]
NPGLCLKNGGPIGLLPLTERDARVIIAAGRRVPFEKCEQTPVNEQVRRPWQLLDFEFEIKNPAWEPFLQSIVREVCKGLGVDAAGNGVQAKLCKMLLYDPGSAFEPHQDLEGVSGMFATLNIVLGSDYEGGEVYVKEGDMTHTFELLILDRSPDVTHEVKPVKTGHRLVLSYRLRDNTLHSVEIIPKPMND